MDDEPHRIEDNAPLGQQVVGETTTKKRRRSTIKRAVKIIVPFEDDNMKEFHLWDWMFDKVDISVETQPDWVKQSEIYIVTGSASDMKELVGFLSENKYEYYLTKS